MRHRATLAHNYSRRGRENRKRPALNYR